MIAVRYVALLAFKRIVTSHAHLVSMHQDAILSCIDDPDISIRLQALDLGASMVNSENLATVVERLMRQLRNSPLSVGTIDNARPSSEGVEPAADSDGEDPGEALKPVKGSLNDAPPLPAEYRVSIMRRILDMCSKDTYANISDFEWYIETLVQLIKLVPPASKNVIGSSASKVNSSSVSAEEDISIAIGLELQNVAVRVSTVREEALNAASSLITVDGSEATFPNLNVGGQGVLQSAVWIVGEYAQLLPDPSATLNHAIHPKVRSLPASTLSAYLQAIPKILITVIPHDSTPWTPERKSMSSLLLARITHFLEPLTTHPNLEVQERCVEFLELMRVAAQAVSTHDTDSDHGPLLLTRAIPSLYTGDELKPVAPTAQRKVPLPEYLDLDTPINPNLALILQRADLDDQPDTESSDFDTFYNVRPSRKPFATVAGPAIDTLPSIAVDREPVSYQQADDPEMLNRKRLERRIRNKDDPFYIPSSEDPASGASTPFHDILRSTNGEDVDVDAIPIMDLDLGEPIPGIESSDPEPRASSRAKQRKAQPTKKKKHHVAQDENLDFDAPSSLASSPLRTASPAPPTSQSKPKSRKNPLEVDSSTLSTFSLYDHEDDGGRLDAGRKEVEDADMARALAEVERLRMEMQRASERVVAPEGEMVRKKKRRKRKDVLGDGEGGGGEGKAEREGEGLVEERAGREGETAAKVKKKKKKKVMLREDVDGTV